MATINKFDKKYSDKKLKEALDIYWEKYKVFGKLEQFFIFTISSQ